MLLPAKAMLVDVARTVRDVRSALGWSQRELADRAGLAQSTISRIERAALSDLTVATAASILNTLGVRASLSLQTPLIADRARQNDAGHARCVAYVVRRLRRLGWVTLTEVEIVDGRSHGWIDVLAYRESDGRLLVIEVKTELVDVGRAERQLGWYERAAWDVARRHGWRPRQVTGALLVLSTQVSLERIAANREHLRQVFRMAARDLGAMVAGAGPVDMADRALAGIDPYNRSKGWLLATPLLGRVVQPRYADYAALMARIRRG
jgi:transcriptional regulator with XRE-family HTH domain